MVAKGVRFNAIKTWTGNFHSTKIYEFRMKCPQCIQRFVVELILKIVIIFMFLAQNEFFKPKTVQMKAVLETKKHKKK